MKFLTCSRCFAAEPSRDSQGHRKPAQEITNPLVVTKRPSPKVVDPPPRPSSPVSGRKRRLPEVLRALASWRRRQRCCSSRVSATAKSVRRNRVPEQPAAPPRRHQQRMKQRGSSSRTQRLIRMYEERAASPEKSHQEFLLEPPASFVGDGSLESHQNFRNKLNTLDFRRMNTVALEEPSTSGSAIYRKNSYVEESAEMPVAKYARKTLLEDFLQERLRIEQAMIDLLNGNDPGSILLKKSRNDDRKVRFKDEGVGNDEEARTLSIVELAPEKNLAAPDDKRVEQQTEIKLSMDADTKIEDFYVERRTTYMKDKTVEDKALVLKLAPKDELDKEREKTDGMAKTKEIVFRNFGKLTF